MIPSRQTHFASMKPLKRFAISFFTVLSPRLKSWANGRRRLHPNRFNGFSALALLMWCVLFGADARAGDENYRAKNISWKLIKDEIVITYDLEGAFTETYNVSVRMLREGDKKFLVEPKTVSGDVGDDKIVGTRKTIRWKFLRDAPNGFAGNDFYFEITVDRAGGFPWLWVGGGAAAAGVAVALLLKKGEVVTQAELPDPPGRPMR